MGLQLAVWVGLPAVLLAGAFLGPALIFQWISGSVASLWAWVGLAAWVGPPAALVWLIRRPTQAPRLRWRLLALLALLAGALGGMGLIGLIWEEGPFEWRIALVLIPPLGFVYVTLWKAASKKPPDVRIVVEDNNGRKTIDAWFRNQPRDE